jgi:hypothetical protein
MAKPNSLSSVQRPIVGFAMKTDNTDGTTLLLTAQRKILQFMITENLARGFELLGDSKIPKLLFRGKQSTSSTAHKIQSLFDSFTSIFEIFFCAGDVTHQHKSPTNTSTH